MRISKKLSPGQVPIPFFESNARTFDPDAKDTLFVATHMRAAVKALGNLSSAEAMAQSEDMQNKIYRQYPDRRKQADFIIKKNVRMSNPANRYGYWSEMERAWLTVQTGSKATAEMVLVMDGPLTLNPQYKDDLKDFTDDMAGPNGAQNRSDYYDEVDKQIRITQNLIEQPQISTPDVYALSA